MSRYTLHVHADTVFELIEVRATLLEIHESGDRTTVAQSKPRYYDARGETDGLRALTDAVRQWCSETP